MYPIPTRSPATTSRLTHEVLADGRLRVRDPPTKRDSRGIHNIADQSGRTFLLNLSYAYP